MVHEQAVTRFYGKSIESFSKNLAFLLPVTFHLNYVC